MTFQLVGLPDPYLRGLEVRSTYLDIVDLWLPIATGLCGAASRANIRVFHWTLPHGSAREFNA